MPLEASRGVAASLYYKESMHEFEKKEKFKKEMKKRFIITFLFLNKLFIKTGKFTNEWK